MTGYDIALVRMSAPVDLGASVSPARLYYGHDSSLLGFHMHTVGWGWTCPTCSGTSARLKAVSAQPHIHTFVDLVFNIYSIFTTPQIFRKISPKVYLRRFCGTCKLKIRSKKFLRGWGPTVYHNLVNLGMAFYMERTEYLLFVIAWFCTRLVFATIF